MKLIIHPSLKTLPPNHHGYCQVFPCNGPAYSSVKYANGERTLSHKGTGYSNTHLANNCTCQKKDAYYLPNIIPQKWEIVQRSMQNGLPLSNGQFADNLDYYVSWGGIAKKGSWHDKWPLTISLKSKLGH